MKKNKAVQIFIQILSLILVSFTIFFRFIRWDLPLLVLILMLGVMGMLHLMSRKYGGVGKSNITIVETKKSDDGFVIAKITKWIQTGKRSIKYNIFICEVKRNYAEGVFYKEKSFDDLSEARAWLRVIYWQKLEKHLQKIEKPAD